MAHQAITILSLFSLLQRNTRRFYDLMLDGDQIGSGQQFFLLRIHENHGISMQDLARMGGFDKGTVTRAVQKLVSAGFARIETDQADKRVRHIYLTEQAQPLVEHIYRIRRYWTETLTGGLTDKELQRLLSDLQDMAERSNATLEKLNDARKNGVDPLAESAT